MASRLYHEYACEPSVSKADIRVALSVLEEPDISSSSPISDGASEVAVVMHTDEEPHTLDIRVTGHSGEWTKKSEEAVQNVIQNVEGVGDLVDSDGGYES